MTLEQLSSELEEQRKKLDELAQQYRDLTALIESLQAQRQEIAQQIIEIWQKTNLKPSRFATVVSGRTSYDYMALVSYLKQKGLREAIVTQETVDTKKFKELLRIGKLTEEELEPFKKKGQPYVQLLKEKEA